MLKTIQLMKYMREALTALGAQIDVMTSGEVLHAGPGFKTTHVIIALYVVPQRGGAPCIFMSDKEGRATSLIAVRAEAEIKPFVPNTLVSVVAMAVEDGEQEPSQYNLLMPTDKAKEFIGAFEARAARSIWATK
jgi:hypothetical protein